jgi:uncharacterized protein (DUF2225 family)
MTTVKHIVLSCPVCEGTFISYSVTATNSEGGRRTDFHPRAAGTQPLAYFIHTCVRCGYSGTDADFSDDAEVSPQLRERVWNELAPHAANRQLNGSEKYEAAAKVAEWQSAEPRQIGDLYLRAAWCCVDEDDVEAERFFRRKAAWAFEAALDSYDAVPRDERAVLTYLSGELWRRIGDDRRAREWFDRVDEELVDPDSQKWIASAARQQRDDPREWFA